MNKELLSEEFKMLINVNNMASKYGIWNTLSDLKINKVLNDFYDELHKRILLKIVDKKYKITNPNFYAKIYGFTFDEYDIVIKLHLYRKDSVVTHYYRTAYQDLNIENIYE